MSDLTLHTLTVSDMGNNCYLLVKNGKGFLIDAADDAPSLLKLAEDAGAKIDLVLTTHRHFDHVRALEEVLEATGAQHLAPYLDAPALPAKVDVTLDHGDVIEFEGEEMPVSILRGHTPGGAAVSAVIDGKTHLFTGDSLFPGGVGKTQSETDFARLFNDVKERLFDVYDDDTIVHPGHGDSTTIGAERPKLDEWWERRW